MEKTDSKKSVSKSINDFSISSLISKFHVERMKKNLNPSRNKSLGRSISSLNVKIQIKKDDTDADIVDRWFQSICRNILNENYEQWEANQPVDSRPRRVERNDLGNGRSEIS